MHFAQSIKYLIITILLLFSYLNADTIDISKHPSVNILPKSDVVINPQLNNPIEVENLLRPYGKEYINTGMSTDNIWIRFTLKNSHARQLESVIYFSSSVIENIIVYKVEKIGGYKVYKEYQFWYRDQKSIFPFFGVKLEAGEQQHFLIHLQPKCMPVDFSIKSDIPARFIKMSRNYHIENILLFGFILSLAIYSFILFFFTKDKSYMFYGFYLFMLMWHQLTYVGIWHMYGEPSFVKFDSEITNLKIGLMIVTSILFAVNFLKVKPASKIFRIYLFYFVLIIVVIVVSATIGVDPNIIMAIALGYVLFNFIAGILSYRQGIKEARLFILGFGIVGASYIVAILDAMGQLHVIQKIPNLLMYTTAIEALVLSAAFADRYMILQKEKEKLDALRLKESIERTQIIEKEVEAKTKKLNEALKTKEMLIQEVQHRVKNNLQIILSMLRMQSYDTQDISVRKKLKDLENRINAIAKSYEMLLVTEEIDKIDMKSYINALIVDIAQAYNFNEHHIEVITQINAEIALKRAVYIGLIINELVTNTYKHGTPKEAESKIYVIFKKVDDMYELIIDDNCGGSIPNKEGYGLGLKLIDALIVSQLDGSYEINKKRITIRLHL